MTSLSGSDGSLGRGHDVLYRTLFENSRDGILIVDDAGRYVDVNPAYCLILKTSREQLIGAHFSGFIPPERLQEAVSAFGDLQSGRPTPVEFPLLAVDGTVVELEWSSSSEYLPGLYFCVCRDITARKQAENELQRREHQLRDFVNSATVGLHWMGPDATIQWANQAELDLLGYTEAEYIGRSIRDFHADSSCIDEILRRLFSGEQVQNFEARLRAKDGSIRYVLIDSNVLHEEGRFIHARCFTRDITDRKTVEANLRRREEQFRTLLENTPDIVSRFDRNCRFLYVSPAVTVHTGLQPEHFIGKSHAEAGIAEELGEKLEHKLHDIFDSGERGTIDFELATPEGEVRYFHGIGVPERDAAGSVRTVLTIVRDITNRKRAEDALRESEARFRSMADSAPVLIWIAGTDTLCHWFNQPWLQFTGRTLNQEAGVGWAAGVHPDDRQRCLDVYLDSFKKREEFRMEYRLRRHDGQWRWMLDHGKPLLTPTGEFAGFIGSCIDLTDRRNSEEALRESEERLRLAQEASGIGIWDWDIQHGTATWTKEIYDFAGLNPETTEPSFALWSSLMHPEDRPHALGDLEVTLKGGQPFATEYRVLRSDGSVRWLLARGRVFNDHSGSPIRMVGVNLDFTEQRLAEDRLRRANSDLQHFAYAASHDLQEPLRMVAVYSQLLERHYGSHLDTRARGFLDEVLKGSQRMGSLIENLLAYSRIAAAPTGDIQPQPAGTALEDALQNLGQAIAETHAEIIWHDLPAVRVHTVHLAQIFQNLISNAIKFRGQSPPAIHVRATAQGAFARFEVADNGIGIDSAYHEQVFGLFKRLHSSAQYQGTGLGLAICQKIVERYGGAIGVMSTPGVGSTFWFTLPASEPLGD